jgi:NTE family protein
VKRTFVFFLCLVLAIPVFLSLTPAAAAAGVPPEKGAIVLALSGGGMKGLSHIGVLDAIREAGIPVAGIVGTSMGSIIGGLSAYGYTPKEIEVIVRELDLPSLFGDNTLPSLLPKGEEGTLGGQPLVKLEFGKDRHLSGPLGGLPGIRVFNKLSSLTAHTETGNFLELPVPFAAVATDLETGGMVILKQGSLAGAMRASMAIPGIFNPWTYEGRLLVDGGLVANVPVSAARFLFPGYPVVAVDVSSGLKGREEIRSLVDVIEQMTTFMTGQNVAKELAGADFVIHPDTKGVALLSTSSELDVIDKGRIAAREAMPVLLSLASKSPPARRTGPTLSIVSSIEAVGISVPRKQELLRGTDAWLGAPPDPAAIQETIDRLREEGDFSTVDVTMEERESGTAVVFNIQKRAAYEVELGGFTTNISPAERGLTLQAVRRDLSEDGDLLWLGLNLAEDWGVSARYLTSSSKNARWEAILSARHREVTPANAPGADWERYSLTLYRTRGRGNWWFGWGGILEQLEGSPGVESGFSWGPGFYVAYEGLDDPLDPTGGARWRLRAWWRDAESLLVRTEGFGAWSFSPEWRILLSGGVEVGDASNPATAAWLGGSDDLLGYGDRPILADGSAWIRVVLRRVLERSWWGSMNVDLFGALGKTFDSGWSAQESLWEAGISLSFPNNFLGGTLFLLYNDESELRWGFSLGRPLPVRDPLP